MKKIKSMCAQIFFKKYFTIRKVDNVNRVVVKEHDTGLAIQNISQFAFIIFDSLSKLHGFPVQIKT